MRQYPIKEFASILGVSLKAVYKWRDKGMPVTETGDNTLVSFEDWARFYAGGSKALNFQEEKARLTKFQADREQIRVEEALGRLVRTDLVESIWASAIIAFKTRIMALPDKIVNITGDASIKPDLKLMVNEALTELSNIDKMAIVQNATDGDDHE